MNKIYIELKWAIIFMITLLSWMLLEKTLGWHEEEIADHWWLTMLFAPFAIFIYLLAVREKRRRVYNKKITWLQGFISGVILTLFVALLSPIAQYITHNYITPEYFKTVIEYSVTNDLMTRTKANDYFNITNYMWQSAFGALGFGIVTAAIVAVFVRKRIK
ncbi:MAG TPA: DUF4199 domain-containing protein [Flavobacteriaceae bacterium]|jgi:glucan phosphoethanolaminetransferase (alkaline phosphatase superfamily)|nr:DUF4199 domain-containing protein [Flavobacteriaceae bacterium]|tara:strand:+ start:106 stop:588 length:483 start_codon:yes stop_codon:yes gene_type:complete